MVTSTGYNGGRLEARGTHGSVTREYAARASGTLSLVGRRVVVCEDEGITQMQVRRALTRAGMTVVASVLNGADALAAIVRERPDIVIMDVRLPVMNGLEAARRALAELPTCVVVLTAFANEGYENEARRIGASGYAVKPISGEALLVLVADAWDEFSRKRGRDTER